MSDGPSKWVPRLKPGEAPTIQKDGEILCRKDEVDEVVCRYSRGKLFVFILRPGQRDTSLFGPTNKAVLVVDDLYIKTKKQMQDITDYTATVLRNRANHIDVKYLEHKLKNEYIPCGLEWPSMQAKPSRDSGFTYLRKRDAERRKFQRALAGRRKPT